MITRLRSAALVAVAALALSLALLGCGGDSELGLTNLDSLGLRDNTTDPILETRQDGTGKVFSFLDGATEKMYMSDGGVVTFVEDPVLPAASVSASEIANVTRSYDIPITAFRLCDGAAAIDSTSGSDAFPDFAEVTTTLTIGLEFDDTGGTEDEDTAVCVAFTVPSDYDSGGALTVRAEKDGETGANDEFLNSQIGVNGGLLQAASATEVTTSAFGSYSLTPTIASLSASDAIQVFLNITSTGTIDDLVRVHGVQFTYTADQ